MQQRERVTLFPPIQQNTWSHSDPALRWVRGEATLDGQLIDAAPGQTCEGPMTTLDTGLYGVEFQIRAGGDLPPETVIADICVVDGQGTAIGEMPVTAADVARPFSGMYQGPRLDLFLDSPAKDISFRINSTGAAPLLIKGFKLIPRPGRTWFTDELDREPIHWETLAFRQGRCIRPTSLGGPSVDLFPGEYRLGWKLQPPQGITTGTVAQVDVVGSTKARSKVIFPRTDVSAEQLLMKFGIPDVKARFSLPDITRNVEFRLHALMPGLVVQWIRLATAEEALWHHYYNIGGVMSALGMPVSAFGPSADAGGTFRGGVRWFEGGAVYYTAQAGPCEVLGKIEALYHALGGSAGRLGFPAGRPEGVGSEKFQKFEHGVITEAGDGSTSVVYAQKNKRPGS